MLDKDTFVLIRNQFGSKYIFQKKNPHLPPHIKSYFINYACQPYRALNAVHCTFSELRQEELVLINSKSRNISCLQSER